jgi:hypothetical protein
MHRLARWIPRLLIFTAAAHVVVAVVQQKTWRVIASNGVWNTVTGQPAREADLWFFLGAPSFLLLGLLARTIIRVTGTVPLWFGVGLIFIGGLISVLSPVGGGWLVLAIGVLSVVVAQRSPVGLPAS